jgi:hypothetical protein
MSKPETILAWHFIRPGFELGYGDTRVPKIGEWLEVPGPVVCCENGLHASIRAADALEFCQWSGGLLCRVEMGGEIAHHADGRKMVAQKRRILWAVPDDPLLWHWLLNFATRALEHHYPDAPDACWHALDLRAAMLAGVEVDDAARAAARAAAWAAARAAASAAARAAAWAAARDAASAAASAAAWSAAVAAAWDAARAAPGAAAWDAARDAARDAQNEELERLAAEAHAALRGEEEP